MKTQTIDAISATQKKAREHCPCNVLRRIVFFGYGAKKNAAKLKGWDAAKAVRVLRDGKLR